MMIMSLWISGGHFEQAPYKTQIWENKNIEDVLFPISKSIPVSDRLIFWFNPSIGAFLSNEIDLQFPAKSCPLHEVIF